MTTLYQTYEDELRDMFKDINTELAELKATLQRDHPNYRPPPGAGPASRVARVKSLNDLNQKLRDLLKDMDRELSSADFPVNLREAARNRLTTEYRRNALTLEKDIVKAKQDSSAADRADLVGSGGASSDVSAVGLEGLDDETRRQRIQMAQNTAKLEKGTKDLKTGERLVIEMEDMSNQAITNLTAQTRTISNIVGKAHEGDEELSQARKILSDMHREMVKNKAILLIIILFLLLMIFLILYIKFGSSSSTTTTTVIIAATPAPGSVPSPPATSTSSGSSMAGSQTF